jgi:transcriptional regulator with XRE-family HTH domain
MARNTTLLGRRSSSDAERSSYLVRLGRGIKAVRSHRSMPRKSLASCLGVTCKVLGYWERGETRPPFDKLIGLWRVLEVTPDELLAAGEEKTSMTWKLGTKKAPGAIRSRVDLSPEGSERRRTMRESTRSGKLGEWQRLQTALQVNQAELPHLETQRTQFETLVGQAEDLFQSQAALSASKQEASQQVAALVLECQRLETVLRLSLKQFYGPRSEKLVEFGIQPFRGRTPKPKLPPPPVESTDPADSTPAAD